MNETLTVTVGHASLYVAGVAAIAGFAVLVAVRGLLTTAIEGARLVARNDERTARWLWRRGYRSTPHAGPDVHDDVVVTPWGVGIVQTTHPELLPADPHVIGELLAVDGVDTETDAPHEDTDRPRRRPVNQPYRGRHWVSDVQHTAEWPVINPSIPAQRTEAE